MAGGVPTWEEVARDHGRFIYTVAYRLAGNDSDAQDLVQEALIRVRKGLETYEPGSLEGWLARIVTNVFLDEVRRRRRRPTEAFPADPDWVLPPAAAADEVRGGGGVLRRRGPLVGAISGGAGVPVGTVRSRLHRGRRLLRAALTE